MASVGTLLGGRYELVALAGEGGMATVYRAVVRGAAGFTRLVAVKRIRPEYRALKHYVDMFVEEARVGSDLAHPNIVQVYDFLEDHELYCLIMEWVEGLDFGSLLREFATAGRMLPWRLVCAVGVGTLRGLGAAHERVNADGVPTPVIHRDVSPHNILIGVNGVVKLTDFGLARARDRIYSLTAPGTVKGKLCYLSPEVSWGKEATAQSDTFSLAAVLWEALTGQRLFEGKSDLEVFRKLRACEVPPLAPMRPDLPEAFVAAINRGLAKDPAERFATAIDFANALSGVLRDAPLMGDSQRAMGAAVVEARRLARGDRAPAAAMASGAATDPSAAPPDVSGHAQTTPGVVPGQ